MFRNWIAINDAILNDDVECFASLVSDHQGMIGIDENLSSHHWRTATTTTLNGATQMMRILLDERFFESVFGSTRSSRRRHDRYIRGLFTNLLEVIINLVQLGADPNVQNKKGKTALHLLVDWADPWNDRIRFLVITKLVDAGTDLNVQDENGQTPLHLLVLNVATALHMTEAVSELVTKFLESGADPNIQDKKGQTAIHILMSRMKSVQDRDRL